MNIITVTLLCACICGAIAQQYNDGPPRLNIPGAIPLGPKQGNFRQGRILASPQVQQAPLRIRRPGQVRAGAFKSVPASTSFLQQLDDSPSKPVTEEADDIEIPSTTSPFLSSLSPYSTPQPLSPDDLQSFFNTSPSPVIKPLSISNVSPAPQQQQQQQRIPEPIKISQPPRPQQPIQVPVPARIEAPVRQQQPVRIAPLSYRPQRPQFRPESRPQFDDDEDDEPEQPIRQQYRQPAARPQSQSLQPAQRPQSSNNPREKKPVAQVIRRYREDNPDGSITWGFENDDGSFKEETIGIDCVTRGRYGYVDPDGLKREYSYETGNPCDKEKEEKEEQGFIDYQENKAVLPNGIVLDLANMGKKSKRPQRQSQPQGRI